MRIGIDMGHTISGPNLGAIGFIKESEETRRLGNLIINYLKSMGQTVINCSVDIAESSSDSLKRRVETANSSSLDIFVSIHFNAGGGHGTEVFTYDAKPLPEAKAILDNMARIGFTNRGIKNGSHLYVIRKTNVTAMLVEVCFVDNKEDTVKYHENIERIAKAIADGIVVKSPPIVKPPVTDPKPNPNLPKPQSKPKYTKKASIKLLQRSINAQGYASPPLIIDGIWGEKTLSSAPTLFYGSIGDITRAVQQMLIVKGMNIGPSGADGIFGKETEAAIKRLQRHYNLKADGIVGKNTYNSLYT
ncbi:MAG: N-acetylmuramoyl-L-alanine amidase [Clostridium sp.]|uniref:N-acetylmuramoyl-L-alanine amidase n=1 Tax=Clostridium sp. TaxID=1506 RepID=UPI002FCAF224